MTDKNLVNKPVDEIISDLRKYAEWADSNIYEVPITLPDAMQEASDRLANDQTHIAALQREIEKLRNGRRWIPVTERLPDKWQEAETREMINYLIFGADFGVDVGSYHAPSKRWICLCLPVQVTHWMPLPPSPGGSVEEAMMDEH